MVIDASPPSIILPGRIGIGDSLPLFDHHREREAMDRLSASDEFKIICDVATACFREAPTEVVWKWAARKVWLDAKMTAEEGWYDPAKTPWTKEIQEAPLDSRIREVVIKKSSRSGFTEAAFNILRWMPDNWPGNAGVVFPEEKQGRDVAKRRIVESIKRIAGGQVSDDPDDIGLSNLHLLNMLIKMGPSGASRMFTEWWVRYFILDELEEHSQDDTTTTYDRALSRQTDVADSLLLAISKPKKAGGPIDKYYIRGSQKQWNVPCPRCERHFIYDRNQFSNPPDCRNPDTTWNLQLVEAHTHCVCPHCKGIIHEKEKRSMNDAALWVRTPVAQRRCGPDGKYVPPVPGVESYQISDYPSYHPKATWGALRVMALMAFEIQPDRTAQIHYINNHDGEADEVQVVSTDASTIDALKAGRIETRKVKLPDGTEVEQTHVLGIPGGYRLAYLRGLTNAPLPYAPTRLLLKADKQKSCIKFTVWSLRVDPLLPGQCEAHLIDLGRVDDENELFTEIVQRPYHTEDGTEFKITAGFIDSRYRGQAVYDFCLRCYHELGLQIWPVRGEGMKESVDRKQNAAGDTRSADSLRGKLIRCIEDQCDRGKLIVRYFKDHALQHLLNDKLTTRQGWRIWLPTDTPKEFADELIAEKYDPAADVWVHNAQKYGPNDYRDTTKYLVLWVLENLNHLLAELGHTPLPPPEEDPEPASKSREYILKQQPS